MRMKSIFRHETILFLVVIVALVILSIQAEQFATIDNLLNQGRFLTEVSLVALIMTFVIVTGGIDLSVGSILGLSAIVLGVAWKKLGLPLPLAILVALSVGTLAGLFNGIIITRFNSCFSLFCANHVAIMVNNILCDVNAFVLATATSLPAFK